MHILNLHFLSDWIITSGEGAGAYADVTTVKDTNLLPYVPGKAIKGLLRDAFFQGIENNWFKQGDHLAKILFGEESASGTLGQGAMQVASAELSKSEKAYFSEHKTHVKFLYRTVHSTQIDEKTGSAAAGSLRSMEVVVPLTLQAELSFNTLLLSESEINEQEAVVALQKILPLLTEIGAKRTRGYGQITIELNKQGG